MSIRTPVTRQSANLVIGTALTITLVSGCGAGGDSGSKTNNNTGSAPPASTAPTSAGPASGTSRLGKVQLAGLERSGAFDQYDESSHTLSESLKTTTVDLKNAKANENKPDKEFEIYFPSKPSVITGYDDPPPTNAIEQMSWTKYLVGTKDLDFLLVKTWEADLGHGGAECKLNDNQLQEVLNSLCTKTMHSLGFTESARHPIKSSHYQRPGVEAEGKLGSGSDLFRMQVFVDKQTFNAYRVIALGSAESLKGAEANKFFESFVICEMRPKTFKP